MQSIDSHLHAYERQSDPFRHKWLEINMAECWARVLNAPLDHYYCDYVMMHEVWISNLICKSNAARPDRKRRWRNTNDCHCRRCHRRRRRRFTIIIHFEKLPIMVVVDSLVSCLNWSMQNRQIASNVLCGHRRPCRWRERERMGEKRNIIPKQLNYASDVFNNLNYRVKRGECELSHML